MIMLKFRLAGKKSPPVRRAFGTSGRVLLNCFPTIRSLDVPHRSLETSATTR